tara:strand:+ start:644 stop:1792 length:1149 start_codon:yes stop_codon:yes gene_type:complete
MNINIFGSTGIIGSKSLKILNKYFPEIKVNLLTANNNVSKLIKQAKLYSPKFVYINNKKKILNLKKALNSNIKIIDYKNLNSFLSSTNSDLSILAISGYRSLDHFEYIIKNTSSLGLVSKEAIVSAGHLFKYLSKNNIEKIFPLDSEHYSIYDYFNNIKDKNFNKLFITASGGPFFGKKFSSLKYVKFHEASKHPKWKMGYKNSIDSATLSNKCLELIEAHYLFKIPYKKLNITIHPDSKIHSIIEKDNFIYDMIGFQNDMFIPIYNFFNKKFKKNLKINKFSFNSNSNFSFFDVKFDEFPIYKLFLQLDKNDPTNIIKFNVGNEYAVNLFKKNMINYTDIYRFIAKISSLNLNYKLNNIKDIIEYHEYLENHINNNLQKYI